MYVATICNSLFVHFVILSNVFGQENKNSIDSLKVLVCCLFRVKEMSDEQRSKINNIVDNQSKRAIVLNQNEWNRLKRNGCKVSDIKRHSNNNTDYYDEYLKNGSRNMVKHWNNTIEKIRERKVTERQLKEEQKKAEGL